MQLFNEEAFKKRIAAAVSPADALALQAEVAGKCASWIIEANQAYHRLVLGPGVPAADGGVWAIDVPPTELPRETEVDAIISLAQEGPTFDAPVTGEKIADVFVVVEKLNRRVAQIYMSPVDFADIRKFGREWFDFETNLRQIQAGNLGTIYGAQVRVSTQIHTGRIYIISEMKGDDKVPIVVRARVLRGG